MGARYLCGHCGLNHGARELCPLKAEHQEKQDLVDKAETSDIKRYGDMLRLHEVCEEARLRAEVMARLELQLGVLNGDRNRQ